MLVKLPSPRLLTHTQHCMVAMLLSCPYPVCRWYLFTSLEIRTCLDVNQMTFVVRLMSEVPHPILSFAKNRLCCHVQRVVDGDACCPLRDCQRGANAVHVDSCWIAMMMERWAKRCLRPTIQNDRLTKSMVSWYKMDN